MRLNPDAAFDCLFLASELQRDESSFVAAELHMFGYLACLLWLYRGNAVTDWGYSFVGTELGAPYSPDVDSAVQTHLEFGYFLRSGERIQMSPLAAQMLSDVAGLAMNQPRLECLKAATESLAAFSTGMVNAALAQEPDLKRARLTPLNRPLLEECARSALYTQFEGLRRGLGDVSADLRLPAVVWLSALYRSNESLPW